MNFTKSHALGIPLSLLLLSSIQAQVGDIIVSAEKFDRNYLKSTSSIYVMDRDQIESVNASSVADLLKRIGGFSVQTNGAYGKASSINLRGTDNRHTLVLIDGVRVTDITSISGGTRLEFIDPAQIEKIEVLKGNQGVLYGSEAVGGVISITTKKEGRGDLGLSYGSYDFKKVSGFNSFVKGDNQLSISGSFQDVDGISAYNEDRIDGAVEDDGLKQTDLLLSWKNTSVKNLTSNFSLEVNNSSYLYDDSNADNEDLFAEYKTSRFTETLSYNYSDFINLDFNYNHFEVDRKLFGENSFGKFHYLYKGSFDRYTLANRMFYAGNGELITGVEYEKERTKALDSLLNKTQTKERFGAYINNYNSIGDLVIEEGLRYENLQYFGDEFVYRLGVGYNWNQFTAKATVGTSFKAPTLYQSFAQFGGNRNLEMERSDSKEVSLLYKTDTFMTEVTYFEIDYDKYIDYDSNRSIYTNSGDFETYGAEWNSEYSTKLWSFGLNYTFLRSKNVLTGEALARRSKHNIGLNTRFSPHESWSFLFDANYRSDRMDSNSKRLPSYYLANLSVEYKWNQNSDRISLAIKNILDKDYEEVWGYGTLGRNFLASYNMRF